ncbi:MAG: Sensory box histidine kinase/response regulator [Myxococcales bacterium]|nr:Sensory box histidine kinase/response regulator [Myxococcales bacterium]
MLAGGAYSFSALLGATAWLRHTDDVRIGVARLQSTLLDAETGARGYLVTGVPAYLEPYDRARAGWRGQLDEVRALTSDNPEQQARLQRLERLIEGKLAATAGVRAAYDAGRRGDALLPGMEQGRRFMDAARLELASMESAEAALDVLRERETRRRWQEMAALLALALFLLLVLIAGILKQRRDAETQRSRAEEEGRFLGDVFAGIDDGITLQEKDGRVVFANASAARTIGFESVEALLTAPTAQLLERFELFDESGQPFPKERLPARAVLAGEPSPAPVLMRYRVRATGEERWTTVQAFPVSGAGGKVVRAVNVFRDVTRERHAEERAAFLLRAVAELGSSLDFEATLGVLARLAVPVLADWCAVDIADEGRPRRLATAHVDPSKVAAVAELERRYPSDPNAPTGVPEVLRTGKAQLVPEIPRELLTAAAVDEEHLRLIDALELRSYMCVPLVVRGKVLGAITFAMAESHRVYTEADLAFARDLADRASLAIENARLFGDAERRRQEAEDQTRFAETFIGMLGHDLRNPLNAIIMTSNLLRRRTPDDTGGIDRILSSSRRMSNMITQLLDLTRSRIAGGIPLDRKETDLGLVVAEVVDELRRTYPAREVAWCRPPELRAPVDRDRLAQVVSNLVGNALEQGDPAKPVTVHLSLGLASQGDVIELSVHNGGAPIQPALLPTLFEPFRLTMARGARSRGLGLGLFITQQIVLAHGGEVVVDSTLERGTTFRVVLPRARPATMASQTLQLVS